MWVREGEVQGENMRVTGGEGKPRGRKVQVSLKVGRCVVEGRCRLLGREEVRGEGERGEKEGRIKRRPKLSKRESEGR